MGFTQQCTSKSRGHFYPAVPSSHRLFWPHKTSVNPGSPLSLGLPSAAIPAATFLGMRCLFLLFAEGMRVPWLPWSLCHRWSSWSCSLPNCQVALSKAAQGIRDIASFTSQDLSGRKQLRRTVLVHIFYVCYCFFLLSLLPSLPPSSLSFSFGVEQNTTQHNKTRLFIPPLLTK